MKTTMTTKEMMTSDAGSLLNLMVAINSVDPEVTSEEDADDLQITFEAAKAVLASRGINVSM